MRSLVKNKQKVYYANYVSSTDNVDENGNITGEAIRQYSTPTEVKLNVSEAKGTSELLQYGITRDYTYVLLTEDLDVDENTIWWIGVPPTEAYNGVTTLVAKSLNFTKIYVKEVSDD